MNELEDRVKAAVDKMKEGMVEFANAIADEGEPEVPQSAIIMFENKGMRDSGIFFRRNWLVLEQGAGLSALTGMFEQNAAEIREQLYS